jgi:hypothetical protein
MIAVAVVGGILAPGAGARSGEHCPPGTQNNNYCEHQDHHHHHHHHHDDKRHDR